MDELERAIAVIKKFARNRPEVMAEPASFSDKPEKIWISNRTAPKGRVGGFTTYPNCGINAEYIRADLAKPSEWISAQLPPNNSSPVLARYRENQPFVAKYVDLTWYDDQGQERDPSEWKAI